MRLLLAREALVGSRLRRSGSMFVAQQKREALASAHEWEWWRVPVRSSVIGRSSSMSLGVTEVQLCAQPRGGRLKGHGG